ncbi:MAG: BamA/TamA family outer membrane protein [Bacteroidaceae bacterium]|nr:BamA/TamA family outer membrane protein [Bacteroidaceae bacterium]
MSRTETIIRYAAAAIALALTAACDTTSNLPPEETLYAGIARLSYDAKPRDSQEVTDSTGEGVITALADAYTTVEGLLTGNAAALKQFSTDDKQMERDSLRLRQKLDDKAYATAREEVEAVLAYAPNGAIMGSSRVRWPHPLRLWVYNRYLYAQKGFGRWMFNTFAQNPRYITTAKPGVRTQVARNTLANYGYFHGRVSHDTIPHPRRPEARLAYDVSPGPLFHLDTIRYMGFPSKADSMIQASARRTLLRQGEPFSVPHLDEERKRLSDLFRNNGYYYFQPEHIAYRADTLQRPLHVQLQVRPAPSMPPQANRQYYIGNTFITLLKYNDRQMVDTIGPPQMQLAFSGGRPRRSPLRMSAITRNLFYKKGDLYRQDVMKFSSQKLSGMGIYSRLRMNLLPQDTCADCDTLAVHIEAMLERPYDAEFEGKVTTKSNGQVGPGATFSMSKLNAFRGAETLSLKAWGSYEWQTGANMRGNSSLINSYEYGVSANLAYPRLMFFGWGRTLGRRALSSTNFLIDSRWLNRASYFGRVSFGARVSYEYQRRRGLRHELTPFRLSYEVKLHSTARFDSIVSANQALYASMRNQFVPSMEYALYWKSYHHAPRTLTVTLKEASAATSAIYALCGQPFSRRGKELFGVPFAQFLKATAQYTHLFRLTPRSGIATRVYAGAVYSYGNSTIAPYSDLFTIGGANSIRAFAIRSIGPGSYQPEHSQYSYIDELGNLKFEANAEYRFPIIAQLYGAIFLDAGNVWLTKSSDSQPGGSISLATLGREIALGTGAGLRYDLDFLVLRLDLGVGIHAPYDTGRSGYYNMTSFGKSLGLHLAVGYPF